MILKDVIEKKCEKIIGLPFNDAGRALNMIWLGFGKPIKKIDKKGVEYTVSEFLLNIQCSWRLTKGDQIVTASRDIYKPNSGWEEEDDFDWEINGDTLYDEKVMSEFNKSRVSIDLILADNFGGLKISFSNKVILEIFPDDSTEVEFWRLYTPGDLESHFVVTGMGIED